MAGEEQSDGTGAGFSRRLGMSGSYNHDFITQPMLRTVFSVVVGNRVLAHYEYPVFAVWILVPAPMPSSARFSRLRAPSHANIYDCF